MEQRLLKETLHRSRCMQQRLGSMCVPIRLKQTPRHRRRRPTDASLPRAQKGCGVNQQGLSDNSRRSTEKPLQSSAWNILGISGTTVYTDHAPSTYTNSLSNKGRLSTWRIHETSDLVGTVRTLLYKAGQYLGPSHKGLADPLSRLRGAVP